MALLKVGVKEEERRKNVFGSGPQEFWVLFRVVRVCVEGEPFLHPGKSRIVFDVARLKNRAWSLV